MSTLETEEELIMIRDFIILPMLLSVIEKNLDDLRMSDHSLKSLYIKTTEIVMDIIHKDMITIRQKLKQANIRVYDRDLSKHPLFEYQYIVRGYTYTFSMRREKIKYEMSIMLPMYINKVIKSMSGL